MAFIAQYALEREIIGAGYYFTVMSIMTVTTRVVFPRLLAKIQTATLIYGSLLLILVFFVCCHLRHSSVACFWPRVVMVSVMPAYCL
ncbi:hypothetical protein ODV97_09270 [Enterococcus gallinarum]|nr:hypothetical protein [Enterococcus gallinarum]